MIHYMNWVKEMFPSISPYTHENALASIKDFLIKRGHVDFLMPTPLPFLAQGDAVSDIPFYYFTKDGDLISLKTAGIVLSTTCDCENDDRILVSPVIPISDYEQNGFDRGAITKNLYTGLLYIPDMALREFVVDLTIINSFNRKLVNDAIERGSITKTASLSLKGFYFFLSKITVHLMRPEDIGANSERSA